MSSKRGATGAVAKAPTRTGSSASQRSGATPSPPPPGDTALPALRRPASRTDSRGRASSPDFWSHHKAASLVDSSVKNPELKVQLLTRALEESRGRIAHLQRDRAAVSEAVLQLCLAAGVSEQAVTDLQAAVAADSGSEVGVEEAALPLRLDLLSTQLQQLQEALQVGEVAVADAQAQHERAALQVVVQQQRREALEAQLEEARYTAQQHEQAQHAMQLKISLLEEQLAATAESARRRMEEQLDTFRGDALTARTLRDKFAELECQLDAARRAQHADADRCHQLEAQVERLQGRLKEANSKQAELSQQLWDKTAAHSELLEQHRTLQEGSKALSSSNRQQQEALAACQKRAQQAEDINEGLRAECHAGQQLQAALQEEADRLKAELQQERGDKNRLQAALAEEQLVAANQRAALQGKGDEIASLLLKLEEYSNRIVAAEGALEGATRQAAQEAALRKQAESTTQQARHECSSLRDSLADLAAAEARWKLQLGEAQAQLAEAAAALEAQRWQCRQQERAAATSKEHVQLLQATLAEQARQLEEMTQLRQQCEGQQKDVAALREELRSSVARQQAAQVVQDELAGAKQQAERDLRKQQVVAQHFQEQCAKLGEQLKVATKEAESARAGMEAAAAQAAQQREEHEAAAAAQREAHEHRRARNEQLEHDNRQQAIIIAELQASCTSLSARLEATQQHNAELHRYAVANGAAYGRLAAHAAGLHQQFARQLGGLLQLCRHLGLQVGAALSAADPVLSVTSAANSSVEAVPATQEATYQSASQAAVAAAVLSIEGLRTELQVAVQLLEMQAGSSEANELADVPAAVADALAADLAGLPAQLLTSPRLEPTASAGGSGRAPAAGAEQQQDRQQVSAATDAAAKQPASAAELPLPAAPSSVLSAQVAGMEQHLERLAHSSTENAARAAAAAQLHEQELAARQRAQDLANELSSRLAAVQADLAATREQRDQLSAEGRRLARELRDSIYTISQMHAERQGQAVSWAVRGLKSNGVQTQYCELWEANMLGSSGNSGCGALAGPGAACTGSGHGACVADASSDGSVLCVAQSSSGSSSGSEDGAAARGGSSGSGSMAEDDGGAGTAARVLPLPALQQLIKEIYSSKALHDIAVARGQRPFMPLADFLAGHLVLQHGSDGQAVQQRAEQLQASVEAHAGVHEVALFGLAAGILEEAQPASAAQAWAQAADGVVLPVTGSASSSGSGSRSATTSAAAAVPLVLYHSRRHCTTPAAQQEATLPTLRRYCAAGWHAAYCQSAAWQPLPQPFNPAASELLHPMCSEVHNLALGVPGLEQLMCWVLGGGLAGCLPHLDLGLRLSESQVPQLYLLVVEACRLLGLRTTPQLYIKNSSEAAVHYLLLPSDARLHGLNGSLAEPAAAGASAPGGSQASSPREKSTLAPASSSSSNSSSSIRGSSCGLAAAESQEWQCALVLTSGLVDLLEPQEMLAVLAGSLGFHAALMSPAAAEPLPAGASTAGREAAQLAVLCRSMAAVATLGALGTLGPEALTQQLPHQMAPFFHSRMQPVLRRALRYLSLFCDRVAAAAAGSWQPVAAAVVKQAAGCAVLRNELNLEAVLQQARALDEAATELLPKALLREEAATVAGAGASLALLRVRELQKWWPRKR